MDGKKYKVSIITVVYNGVKTIEQTIQSVLRQTYKNIEYIIVDGLSTDGTQKIVEKYMDSIACFISEKDDGIYDAMNKGIERATGEIIGIINSDDWYAENAVEKIVKCFEQTKAGLVYGKVSIVFQNGEVKVGFERELDSMWYQLSVSHPTVFVRRGIYKKFGMFDTQYKIASDYDFLLNLYSRQVEFGYVDDVISYFRLGGTSTIREKEMEDEAYEISMKYVEKCPNKDKALPIIQKKYQWACFGRNIRCESGLLFKLLCQYLGEEVKEIIIFGAGTWGVRCRGMLLADGVKVLCFSDNDEEKWHTECEGVKVVEPQKLQDMDAYVLIAVKDGGEEIRRQLESMGGNHSKCVSLEELAVLYFEKFVKREIGT